VPQSHPSKGIHPPRDNYKLVLIGEDDIDDQEFLIEMFASIDDSFKLVFALNGTKVLDYLEKCKDDGLPCLILLDYNMPEKNGAEILEELKLDHRYASIPKVIWSTSRSQTYKDICLELGANDYVIKPSNVNDFVEVIRYILSFCKVN